jgi:predicted nuclease of predicted toxin-antitoxin system
MLRLASDADVKGPILEGLFLRQPDIDLIRVQDAGLRTADDPFILAWAASEGRILITHDRATMIGFAYDRIRAGLPMPGVFVTRDWPPYGPTIDEILIVNGCSMQHAG